MSSGALPPLMCRWHPGGSTHRCRCSGGDKLTKLSCGSTGRTSLMQQAVCRQPQARGQAEVGSGQEHPCEGDVGQTRLPQCGSRHGCVWCPNSPPRPCRLPGLPLHRRFQTAPEPQKSPAGTCTSRCVKGLSRMLEAMFIVGPSACIAAPICSYAQLNLFLQPQLPTQLRQGCLFSVGIYGPGSNCAGHVPLHHGPVCWVP